MEPRDFRWGLVALRGLASFTPNSDAAAVVVCVFGTRQA